MEAAMFYVMQSRIPVVSDVIFFNACIPIY